MNMSTIEVAAGKIFLCYRREDSGGYAGRVYDRLNQRFPGRVFMDVAGVGIGTRWAEVIEKTLASCEVVVVLIGRRWLQRDLAGTRRIDDPKDWIQTEITTALRLKLRIIPLLVDGAAVPQQDELPEDLAAMNDWQALRIDDDDFDHDATRLVKALERHLKDEGPDPHLESTVAISTEIRRLLASAESSIAREDWITAAQTLRAVLSLDRTHEVATARLRFVQQQTTRAFEAVSLPPIPPKRRTGRSMAFGVMGFLGGFGIAIVVAILMMRPVSAGKEPDPVKPVLVKPIPVKPVPPPARKASAAPQMAGTYELTSYILQGVTLPVSGSMRLVPVSDGHFRFEMSVIHPSLGEYRYSGRFEGQDSLWTMTTEESSDPNAIKTPVPAQVSFDGSTLGMQNVYASVVWKKGSGKS